MPVCQAACSMKNWTLSLQATYRYGLYQMNLKIMWKRQIKKQWLGHVNGLVCVNPNLCVYHWKRFFIARLMVLSTSRPVLDTVQKLPNCIFTTNGNPERPTGTHWVPTAMKGAWGSVDKTLSLQTNLSRTIFLAMQDRMGPAEVRQWRANRFNWKVTSLCSRWLSGDKLLDGAIYGGRNGI